MVFDVTPPSPIAPSISSPSPLKDPLTRSMMKKIQMGLPIDGHKSNGACHITFMGQRNQQDLKKCIKAQ